MHALAQVPAGLEPRGVKCGLKTASALFLLLWVNVVVNICPANANVVIDSIDIKIVLRYYPRDSQLALSYPPLISHANKSKRGDAAKIQSPTNLQNLSPTNGSHLMYLFPADAGSLSYLLT